jgi:hypothetical protein
MPVYIRVFLKFLVYLDYEVGIKESYGRNILTP